MKITSLLLLMLALAAGHIAEAEGSKAVERDGSTKEKAVIISAESDFAGVHEKNQWILRYYPGAQFVGSESVKDQGRYYDVDTFTAADGTQKTLWFDITRSSDNNYIKPPPSASEQLAEKLAVQKAERDAMRQGQKDYILNPVLYFQAAFLLFVGAAVCWLVLRSRGDQNQISAFVRLAGIFVFLVASGMAGGAWFGSVYPPGFAVITIGVLTFLELIVNALRNAPDRSLQDGDLRIAITGAMTTAYLALVGYGVFFQGSFQAGLAQSLTTSFTSIVGIVIAFYFGTTAYLDARKEGTKEKDATQKEPETSKAAAEVAKPSERGGAPSATVPS